MLDYKVINQILGIKESYELPKRLMHVLLSDDKDSVLEKFDEQITDKSVDVLRDYFQTEQADRKKMQQDYTPDCVCKLVNLLVTKTDVSLDVCSGTGALSISADMNGVYCFEELSTAVIPVLLLNLALRNANAFVSEKDVLTDTTNKVYKLTSGNKYSSIEIVDDVPYKAFDRIVSNPPYSVKFDDAELYRMDPRFIYGITPNQYSEYLFVQDALSRLAENGTLIEILPTGVLFRGKKEGDIRRNLIEANLIDCIIELPLNLFLNTSIAVILLILKKNKKDKNILFIDASKKFDKQGKVNVMNDKHIDDVIHAYKLRANIEKLSRVVTYEEMKKNDFNLNIPRYVDTFETEPLPDMHVVFGEMLEIKSEINNTSTSLLDMMDDLVANNEDDKKTLDFMRSVFKELSK